MSRKIVSSKGIIQIRRATQDDAECLRKLRLEALERHPESFTADYDATAAQTAEEWAVRLRDNTDAGQEVICLAVSSDELIGMAGLFRGRWPKTKHQGTIWGMYVKEEWRGYGIAGALIEGCVDWAKDQGMVIIRIGAVSNNLPAIRCYLKSGFSEYGLETKVICIDGNYFDEILFSRDI
ncbi:MAG: GNAT family N-acetyltransferase [Anaerolineales bacterium]|nr:GNAT family N-acetyltransferase [Anaerolineales bacterium]